MPYWQQLIEVNRDRLAPPGDPDLIHPGQRFHLPDPPPDPTAEVADGDERSARPSIVEADGPEGAFEAAAPDEAHRPAADAGTQIPEPQPDIDAVPSELEDTSSPAGPAGQAQPSEPADARNSVRDGIAVEVLERGVRGLRSRGS